MISNDELDEIDRRVQAAGAANCWTGTAGAMAADCRRLVKELRNEPANAPRRGRLIGIAGPAGAGKDTAAATTQWLMGKTFDTFEPNTPR